MAPNRTTTAPTTLAATPWPPALQGYGQIKLSGASNGLDELRKELGGAGPEPAAPGGGHRLSCGALRSDRIGRLRAACFIGRPLELSTPVGDHMQVIGSLVLMWQQGRM